MSNDIALPSGNQFLGSRIPLDGKDPIPCINLRYCDRNELEALVNPVETFRQERKAAIKEREYWATQKKTGVEYEPKFAKQYEKFYLQCERACTLMMGYYQTDGHYDLWPVELAPALEYVINKVIFDIWRSAVTTVDIALDLV